MPNLRDFPWRDAALLLFLIAAFVWLAPKVRLHPASLGITNNNWNGDIVYVSEDGSYAVHCDFMGHDSTPYWEGQVHADEALCSLIPVYLHNGLPPKTIRHRVNGRDVELHAPLLWGRLI